MFFAFHSFFLMAAYSVFLALPVASFVAKLKIQSLPIIFARLLVAVGCGFVTLFVFMVKLNKKNKIRKKTKSPPNALRQRTCGFTSLRSLPTTSPTAPLAGGEREKALSTFRPLLTLVVFIQVLSFGWILIFFDQYTLIHPAEPNINQ